MPDLVSVDWQSLLHFSTDINVMMEEWTNMLSVIIQKHAPILERRVSERYCPWLNSDLKRMFRSRGKLKMAAVKKKSEVLMAAYKQLRNNVISTCKRLKREYFTDKIKASGGNLKETWATINKLVNKK